MTIYDQIPNDEVIANTIAALTKNGMTAEVVQNGEAAKKRVLEMVPPGAEVMQMSSMTLDEVGLSKELNESGKYNAVKPRLYALDRKTQELEMQKMGAAPEWTVGSVHALTEDGQVIISSNTGSQLPAYAYGSLHVIWVVGAQKIVKDLGVGLKRISDYVLPLESERMKKLYGFPSNVSKLLIISKEIKPGRISVVIVKEKLGF